MKKLKIKNYMKIFTSFILKRNVGIFFFPRDTKSEYASWEH